MVVQVKEVFIVTKFVKLIRAALLCFSLDEVSFGVGLLPEEWFGPSECKLVAHQVFVNIWVLRCSGRVQSIQDNARAGPMQDNRFTAQQ